MCSMMHVDHATNNAMSARAAQAEIARAAPERAPRANAHADADVLRDLGLRVRQLREQRGMARKLLAARAAVSERYLAQLESGEGNSSILLLHHVARALGTPLAELLTPAAVSAPERLIRDLLERMPAHRQQAAISTLLRDFDAGADGRTRRVALLGLRGAGKSTLGPLLAAAQKLPFVELDKEIEREAGLSLSEVFALYGETGYRRIERQCLQKLIPRHEGLVLAVGGGIVSEAASYELLLSSFVTVWLKATPEEHMGRVIAQGDSRPMKGHAEAMGDLKRILAAREPLYARADLVLETSKEAPHKSVARLRQMLRRTIVETRAEEPVSSKDR